MKILLAASNMVHIKNFHLPYIEAFKEKGNIVKVMASGEGADFDVPFKKRAFSLKNLVLSFKIRKILKKEQFDAIYLHTTLAAFWVRFAMWGIKKRPTVVNTVHGYLFSSKSSWLKRKIYLSAERVLRRRTNHIFVMNEEDFHIATENKLCTGRVVLIDGMGIAESRLLKKEPKNHTNDIKTQVFVGEISKRKNQIFLVKALEKLENMHLVLVGDGDERKNIESYARKHNLSNRITITGFTKDVKRYLSEADMYVSASTIEGLPFNIIEAMSASLPIVASDIKGQRDLLPKECLYPLNDEDAYVELVKNICQKNQDFNIEKYKLNVVVEKNVNLYLGNL